MSATQLRLILVRHGEVAANVGWRYIGSSDEPLTDHGAWQAAQLAIALAPLPLAAVYASPLRRAIATAKPIAAALGLPVQVEPRLREGGFGAWEGLSRAEVLARSPEDAQQLAHWDADPSYAPPGGESLATVQARSLDLVEELAAANSGAWLVLVTHVGPIKGLLCAALQAPLTAARHLLLDTATLSVVDWGERPGVWLVNAHAHGLDGGALDGRIAMI
jgi:broad specificity phosphatase PhoE